MEKQVQSQVKFKNFALNLDKFFEKTPIDFSLEGEEFLKLGRGEGEIQRKYALLTFVPRADERDSKAVELIKFRGIRDMREWIKELNDGRLKED